MIIYREVLIALSFLFIGLYGNPKTFSIGSWGLLFALIGWIIYILADYLKDWEEWHE